MSTDVSNDYPDNWDTLRRKVYRRDDYQCQNCGRWGGEWGEYQLEAHHIVPLSQGGSNEMSNLVTLCEQCHDAAHGQAIAPTADREPQSGGLLVKVQQVYATYKALKRATP